MHVSLTLHPVVWHIKDNVVKVAVVCSVSPTDKVVANHIHIGAEKWEGVTWPFDLWNICKDFLIGAEVNLLVLA